MLSPNEMANFAADGRLVALGRTAQFTKILTVLLATQKLERRDHSPGGTLREASPNPRTHSKSPRWYPNLHQEGFSCVSLTP